MLLTPPPVTPSRTPSPLERDVLYGRPLIWSYSRLLLSLLLFFYCPEVPHSPRDLETTRGIKAILELPSLVPTYYYYHHHHHHHHHHHQNHHYYYYSVIELSGVGRVQLPSSFFNPPSLFSKITLGGQAKPPEQRSLTQCPDQDGSHSHTARNTTNFLHPRRVYDCLCNSRTTATVRFEEGQKVSAFTNKKHSICPVPKSLEHFL